MKTKNFAYGLFMLLCVLVTAQTAFAQQFFHIFNHNTVGGYINAPTVAGDGTLVLRNTNPRPNGSQAYVTGVGQTVMPAYNAGDTLQWAILARTTTGATAPLNIGVQNGSGDVNNLSIGQVTLPTMQVTDEFQWILTSPVQVNVVKTRAYFWIPGATGQEIEIKQIVLGDPGSIQAHLRPVSWWTANGDAKDSVDGNPGALTNGATLTNGKIGSAFSFDGVNDYIQVGNKTSLKMTDAVTVEAWIYPTGAGSDPSSGGIIVNKEGEYEIARFADGTIRWAVANSGITWTFVNTGFVAPLNQWTHIALSYGDGSVRTFANGALVHTRTYNSSSTLGDAHVGQEDFRIGGRQSSCCNQYFRGSIDEVKVYNRTRSASEIQNSFASAGNYTASGLVANPDFETDVPIGTSLSPLALSHGNFVGYRSSNALLSQSPIAQPNSTGSRSASVRTTEGGSGGYFYQDFNISSRKSYDLTFYVRPEQGTQSVELIWDWGRGGGAQFGTLLNFSQTATTFRAYSQTQSNLLLPALSAGQWHKVRIVANAGTLTQDIYFDDVMVGTTPVGTALSPSMKATLIMGKLNGVSPDDTQFYFDDVALSVDTTAPVLSLSDVTAEATSANGASVHYTATATDDFDGDVAINCNPALGSTFALGQTTVNCSASDSSGNTANGSFTVTVQDTTQPVIQGTPANQTLEATSPQGAAFSWTMTATDMVDGAVAVNCNYLPGYTFPIGTTQVNCSATDASGNAATDSFNVTVQDTTAPVIGGITADPSVLFSPNHKLADINLSYAAKDVVSTPVCSLSAVSNEPDNGTGDGDTSGDIVILDANRLRLRAERAGNGNGRIYTITVSCQDEAGNTSNGTTTVSVPKSKGR
jgi:hypothetical protein